MADSGKSQIWAPGDVVCGRYLIGRRIGVGAMGSVFAAEDTWLQTRVALKVPNEAARLNPRMRALWSTEATLARRITHPNVCRVYDLIAHDGLQMLTMELIRGETLQRRLAPRGRSLDPDHRLGIARALCFGVDAIHRSGIVHRDLKPSNVMIDRRGRTVIIDFGIADRACAPSSPRSGTEGYMAPEQLAGEGVTQKSDLYCLGLVLYELFQDQRPFAADGATALLRQQWRGPRFTDGPRRLAPGLRSAIERCLAPDPAARPASARAVAKEISCVAARAPRRVDDESSSIVRGRQSRVRRAPRVRALSPLGIPLIRATSV